MSKNGLKSMSDFYHLVEETPLVNGLGYLVAHQVLAWPMYLFFYVSGGKESLEGARAVDGVGKEEKEGKEVSHSHFNPSSGLFAKSQWLYVVLSDLGLLAMLSFLAYAGMKVGWMNLGLLYGVPYFWVHHWLGRSCFFLHQPPSDKLTDDIQWQ